MIGLREGEGGEGDSLRKRAEGGGVQMQLKRVVLSFNEADLKMTMYFSALVCCVPLTCVDQVLVGESRVVDVVDGGGEDGRHHLQRGEHSLS